MIHLIFEKPDMKLEARRERRGRKQKKSHAHVPDH
jgi:hypothetical protein